MLAPFTAGWQSTDTNPLVIEKSKVYFLFRTVYSFVFQNLNYPICFLITRLIHGYRVHMSGISMEISISILWLVYGARL